MEAIKARLTRDARQGSPNTVGPPKSQTAADAAHPTPEPASPVATPPAALAARPDDDSNAKAKEEVPTILPQMEVKKSRITELDDKLNQQEREIIREKKNTVPTEVDNALNDSKIARAFSIFGGESNQYRANIASERVSMMEDEKDLIEAIAHANTKEEKKELKNQLAEMKKMRRELQKSLK